VGVADYVVHLNFAACTNTAGALYASIQMNGNRRMRAIRLRLSTWLETRFAQFELPRPSIEFTFQRIATLGDIGLKQFQNHSLGSERALAVRGYHHPRTW
jgi:hypothetical protein